jgi:hypothetical protein
MKYENVAVNVIISGKNDHFVCNYDLSTKITLNLRGLTK